MESTQIIAERIKYEAQSQGVRVKDILGYYEMDKNLINKLANGKDTTTQKICKIADYLHCSTDYLLGRTDSPTGTYSINNNTNINGTQNNVINSNTSTPDTLTDEFIEKFKQLDFEEKVDVMHYVNKTYKK